MEDDWHVGMLGTNPSDEPVSIREAELLELVRAEVVCPTVKQLHHLRTRLYLVGQVHDERLGEMIQKRVQHLGIVHHHGLGDPAILLSFALHCICRKCPGGANKPDKRSFVVNGRANGGQNLLDKRQRGLGVIHGLEGPDIVHAPHRVHDSRALALNDVKLDAHRRQGSKDVGEKDDSVSAKCPPGLQRELDGDVGRLGAVTEGVLVGVLAELSHVAAGLAH
mmetsp:Transcript_12003/g.30811  ORF Transcript_12003/g.30811 Transcript_12003/m.30811 type:complete len:222 (+) Transcript_12003:395-1060(+)